jgi:DnaK suppressor protein
LEEEKIKQLLQEEIRKTEKVVEEYREMSEPVAPDDAIGRISRMDAINNKSVTEASLRQAEKKLKSLHRVLSLVGTSEFGICLKCRQAIPAARILYRPESLYCVDCAT